MQKTGPTAIYIYIYIYMLIHIQRVPKKCIHILRDIYVKCVYIFLAPSVYLLIWYKDRGRMDTISLLLNLGTQQKCVVNFTPWPHFPPGKNAKYPLNGGLGGSQSHSGHFVEEKNLQVLPWFSPKLSSPKHSHYANYTTLAPWESKMILYSKKLLHGDKMERWCRILYIQGVSRL